MHASLHPAAAVALLPPHWGPYATTPLSAIATGSLGRSPMPTGEFSTLVMTSIPSSTSPNTTCLLSSHGQGIVVMKNLSGVAEAGAGSGGAGSGGAVRQRDAWLGGERAAARQRERCWALWRSQVKGHLLLCT